MYTHILIATDGSELASKAETQAGSCQRAQGLGDRSDRHRAVVELLEVAAQAKEVRYTRWRTTRSMLRQTAAKIVAAVKAIAKDMGVTCDTMHVKDHHPADGIVETAKAKGCDLIMMASHGRRGFKKALLGSQANKVLAYGSIPVLICK